MKVEKIVKKLNGKIKKSKIYDILKYFYYQDEFLKYIEAIDIKELNGMYGKNNQAWLYINKFEQDKKELNY